MSKSSELDKTAKLYILDCIDSEDESLTTIAEKIAYCESRFNSEAGWNIDRIGRQAACTEWLQGLAINIEFSNYEILKLAKQWGSIPNDATERQEDKILDNYWNFMSAKLCQLFDGYRVPKEV